jgi:hypothetical protein
MGGFFGKAGKSGFFGKAGPVRVWSTKQGPKIAIGKPSKGPKKK